MRKYLVWVLILWLLCLSVVFAQNVTMKPRLGRPINWTDTQAKGLKFWWLFMEGSGDQVKDLTPNGRAFIPTGQLKDLAAPFTFTTDGWSPGKFGKTLDFGGSGDHVDCRFPPSLEGIFTISFWCNFEGYVGNATPVSHVAPGGTTGWMFYSGGAGNQMSFFVYNFAVDLATDPSTIPLNEWHHWAGVSDPVYTSLYRDGVLVARATKGAGAYAHVTTVPLFFGRYGLNAIYFNGLLDDVRIYNDAKTDDEIFDIYSDPYRPFRRTLPIGWAAIASAIGQVIMIQ
jgi:hypothetical protein